MIAAAEDGTAAGDVAAPGDVRSRVEAYYAAITRGDIEAVLNMFAADGAMRDPVGTPAAADDMARRQRYAGIGAAFASFAIAPDEIIVGGDEAAARWRATAIAHGGRDVRFNGISAFVFDAEGRIAIMSAYWEPAAVASALS